MGQFGLSVEVSLILPFQSILTSNGLRQLVPIQNDGGARKTAMMSELQIVGRMLSPLMLPIWPSSQPDAEPQHHSCSQARKKKLVWVCGVFIGPLQRYLVPNSLIESIHAKHFRQGNRRTFGATRPEEAFSSANPAL
jgi:hypothetical protein